MILKRGWMNLRKKTKKSKMRKKLENLAHEMDIQIKFADGHDNAIVGLGRQFNTHAVIYNQNIVIQNLCHDMSYEDALEYFEYNIAGAYVGENTPIFLILDLEDTSF